MLTIGVVTYNRETNNRERYSVVDVKVPNALNYRMFIPEGEEKLTPGQKIEITIKPLPYLREAPITPNYDRIPFLNK